MANSDKTFCSSDCIDVKCERHKTFAPLYRDTVSFADLSIICKLYVKGDPSEDNK